MTTVDLKMPSQQEQDGVQVKTKLIKYIVLGVIICGALLGVYFYEPTLVTVAPPILHTMTTEKVRLSTRKPTANTPSTTILLRRTTTSTETLISSTTSTTSSTEKESSTATVQDQQIFSLRMNRIIDGYEEKYPTHSKMECR